MEIIVHDIAKDGLPDMDNLTGRVAFIFAGCIVSGWPLDDGESWEADSDVGRGGRFYGVTHWVEFPAPVWDLHDTQPEARGVEDLPAQWDEMASSYAGDVRLMLTTCAAELRLRLAATPNPVRAEQPEGKWRLVPVEPTKAMLDAAWAYGVGDNPPDPGYAYRAMLAAAPAAPVVDDGLHASIVREAADLLTAVSDSGVQLPKTWRWPLIDELHGIAALTPAATPRGEEPVGIPDKSAASEDGLQKEAANTIRWLEAMAGHPAWKGSCGDSPKPQEFREAANLIRRLAASGQGVGTPVVTIDLRGCGRMENARIYGAQWLEVLADQTYSVVSCVFNGDTTHYQGIASAIFRGAKVPPPIGQAHRDYLAGPFATQEKGHD